VLKSNHSMSRLTIAFVLSLVFIAGASTTFAIKASADDSTSKKIKNDAEDAKKNARKSGRKAKKTVRDKTGHGSVKKDMQDKGKDVQDDVSTEYKKMTD
jgi:hypothetical protein